MITVTICVGSSCHIKGSRAVIGRFSELLRRHGVEDKVQLKGSFCMERCGEGVNWQLDDEPFTSVDEDDACRLFQEKVLAPLGVRPADGPEEADQA
ncbi:hypothetical protein LCGC14_2942210 [marine sediment metagenome]|uniref:(2Fe-2S) ferredoxin domain-containing protein n=1 Tax=marine sediment metagenome TaxID=412755 RepID=A0A0F8XHJ3_9ZZZZ